MKPAAGWLLLRGWRVAMMRRIGLGDREPLPRLGELGRLLADGLVLWNMKGLYWLPELVLLVVFGRKLVQRVLEVLWWAFEKLFGGDTTTTLGSILTGIGTDAAFQELIPSGYLLVIWPLYRAAMIRYALTGRTSAFFNVPGNLALLARHLDGFVLVFFFALATWSVLGVVSAALLSTWIGSVLIPLVVMPLYHWTTGHLYGRLAARVQSRIAPG